MMRPNTANWFSSIWNMEVGGGFVGNDLSEGMDSITRITIGAECLRMGQHPVLLED
jgi:hypothetical protein